MDRDDADEALVRAAREGGGDDELAAHLHALRDELTAPRSPQARWNHLAAMRRAAADATVDLAGDASAELPVEATVVTHTPRRRGNRAVVLVAAATIGVVGVTGGLAAAGRLPRAAQDRVADVAEVVGIDLPKHDDSSRDRPTKPRTAPGATGFAPAVGPRGPGATGTLPGSSGFAPGHSPTGPGSSENAPGHTKDTTGNTTPPGSSGSAPGKTGGTPGSSGTPPGPTGSNGNGNAGTPPGQTGSNGNGNAGTPPGQTGSNGKGSSGAPPAQSLGKSGDAPGQNTASGVAPGSSGNAPGHTTGTAGSSPVQGTDQ